MNKTIFEELYEFILNDKELSPYTPEFSASTRGKRKWNSNWMHEYTLYNIGYEIESIIDIFQWILQCLIKFIVSSSVILIEFELGEKKKGKRRNY